MTQDTQENQHFIQQLYASEICIPFEEEQQPPKPFSQHAQTPGPKTKFIKPLSHYVLDEVLASINSRLGSEQRNALEQSLSSYRLTNSEDFAMIPSADGALRADLVSGRVVYWGLKDLGIISPSMQKAYELAYPTLKRRHQ